MENKEAVRDIAFTLNTGQVGYNQFTTDKLNGKLEALILINEKQTNINITISSELGYEIYKENQHEGIHYFPLKITPLNQKSHQKNFDGAFFCLNEKIIIKVSGPKNKDIKIIFRFCS